MVCRQESIIESFARTNKPVMQYMDDPQPTCLQRQQMISANDEQASKHSEYKVYHQVDNQ